MAKRMTFKRAKKLMKHVIKINDNVPRINWGGCLYFAVHLAKVLIEMGYSPTIVGMTNVYCSKVEKEDFNRTLDFINGGQEWGLTANDHYVVRVGKYFFDSEGFAFQIKGDNYVDMLSDDEMLPNWIVGEMDVEQAEFLYDNYPDWNPAYSRRNNREVVTYLQNIKNKSVI